MVSQSLLPYDQAIQRILNLVSSLGNTRIPLAQALGRALDEPILATQRLPPFDNSAMDGYALRFEDTQSAAKSSPITLPVHEVIAAGHPASRPLGAGEAMRIFTGAPMPKGANAVVLQENTAADGHFVQVFQEAQKGDHIRKAGEDVERGRQIFEAAHVIGPGDIAMMVAQQQTHVRVIRKPRIAILPTGDELVELGKTPGPGQIANSNGLMIQVMCEELGAIATLFPIVRDTRAALAGALENASKEHDLILTIGGVSVGDFDHVQSTLEQNGKIDFWKVAIKPGKPVAFGQIHDTHLLGLPGNPAAAFVCFELFARPAILKLAGKSQKRPLVVQTALEQPVRQNKSRQQFLRAKLEQVKSGYSVKLATTQGSGQHRSMTCVNALVEIPMGNETLKPGFEVQVIALNRYFQG